MPDAGRPNPAADGQPPAVRRPWKRAAAWLAFLGPFFYLSYGYANHMAAQRVGVPSIVFGWEHAIPFLAWTILPYWTTNLFYAASLFLARSRQEVDTLGLRLLTVQLLAVSCFLLWPLAFSFPRPQTHGLFGAMFDALTGFDKPFNQAPSLHIALTVILWVHYAKLLPRVGRWWLHGWFALVCVSILTTYQHHFIDLPTGLAAGWFVVWLWPERVQAPWRSARVARDPARWRLAALYAFAAVACAVVGTRFGGAALWLWWGTLAFGLVALHYAVLGPTGFQKRDDGALSTASRWLHAPYLLGAWINSRAWTHRNPDALPVTADLWLGRIPSQSQRGKRVVVDVCAELSLPGGARAGDRCVPMLDLVAPTPGQLREAALAIDAALAHGEVLVCCALGYSRSACALAAWLLHAGRATTVDDAIAQVSAAAPRVVLRARHRDALQAFASCRHGSGA